jgi:hypothetical protein
MFVGDVLLVFGKLVENNLVDEGMPCLNLRNPKSLPLQFPPQISHTSINPHSN